MAHLQPEAFHNPLSFSSADEDYTGFGCFPLGHHYDVHDVTDVVQHLRHLRHKNMLKPISTPVLQNMQSQFESLRAAQSFWSRPRDAQQAGAIAELLDATATSPTPDTPKLKIYIFPDSSLLNSTQPQFWGLSELDIDSRTTILYISDKQPDVAGTALHTFMSSRQCARSQCFLAEYVMADQAGTLSKEMGLPERLQRDIDALDRGMVEELMERLEGGRNLEAPVLTSKLGEYCEERLSVGVKRGIVS